MIRQHQAHETFVLRKLVGGDVDALQQRGKGCVGGGENGGDQVGVRQSFSEAHSGGNVDEGGELRVGDGGGGNRREPARWRRSRAGRAAR